MKKTELMVAFFKSKNYAEISSKSRKYRTFSSPTSHLLYFIGKHGAVRFGKTSSSSRSITEQIEKAMGLK